MSIFLKFTAAVATFASVEAATLSSRRGADLSRAGAFSSAFKSFGYRHASGRALSAMSGSVFSPPIKKIEIADLDGGVIPWPSFACLHKDFIEQVQSTDSGASSKGLRQASKERHVTDPSFNPEVTEERLTDMIKELKKQRELSLSGQESMSEFAYDVLRVKARYFAHALGSADQYTDIHSPTNDYNERVFETFSRKGVDECLRDWEKQTKIPGSKLALTPLINGLNVLLSYKNGMLCDAFVYELNKSCANALNLIRYLPDVPKIISERRDCFVRGVLTVNRPGFVRLNKRRFEMREHHWLSPRSAILASLVEDSEPNKELESMAQCYAFDIRLGSSVDERGYYGGHGVMPLSESVTSIAPVLAKNNFRVPRVHKCSFEELPGLLRSETAESESGQQARDGWLIRFNDRAEQGLLKHQGLLYKATPPVVKTKMKDIDFVTSGNGMIVANLFVNRVNSGKNAIHKIAVHTPKEITRLGLKRGDDLVVYAGHDGQPRILFSRLNGNYKRLTFTDTCPRCEAKPKEVPWRDETALFCSAHFACLDDSALKILRFGSIHGLNVNSLDRPIVRELAQAGLLSSVSDIFYLTEQAAYAVSPEYRRNFRQLLDEIDAAKKTSLDRFVYALNVPGLTYAGAQELSYRFGTLARLKAASAREYAKLTHVDAKLAQEVSRFFNDGKNVSEITRCVNGGLVVCEPSREIMELCYGDDFGTKKNYRDLVDKIIECEEKYSLSDFEFDLLNKKADEIEAEHPDFKISRKPVPSRREIIEFTDPVKLVKTYSSTELKGWLEKDVTYCVEPKINGVACTLFYNGGELYRAVTRHTVKSGLDITDVVLRMNGIPKKLTENASVNVRGELFIEERALREVNEQCVLGGKPKYKDALAAVVGVVTGKKRDSIVADSVCFLPYHSSGVAAMEGIRDRKDFFGRMALLGFKAPGESFCRSFADHEEMLNAVTDVENRRGDFPFAIDGIAIKPLLLENKGNEYAYKFSIEDRKTSIVGVRFNVDGSGILRSVVEVEPVKFSNGRNVSSVSLREAKELDSLRKGGEVVIRYAGGASPVLEEILDTPKETKREKIVVPTECPYCACALKKDSGGVVKCDNARCRGKRVSRLERFSAKIGVGKRISRILIDKGIVSSPFDFYQLTSEDLRTYGMDSLTVTELLSAVNRGKNTRLPDFMKSLKIGSVSSYSIDKFCQAYPTIDEIMGAKAADVENIMDAQSSKELLDFVDKHKSRFESLRTIGMFKNQGAVVDVKEKYREYLARKAQIHSHVKDLLTMIGTDEKTTVADIAAIESLALGDKDVFGKWKRFVGRYDREKNDLREALSSYARKVRLPLSEEETKQPVVPGLAPETTLALEGAYDNWDNSY